MHDTQLAAIKRSRNTLSRADLPARRKEVCVAKPPASLRPETVQEIMDRMDFTTENEEVNDRYGESHQHGVWA